MFKHLFIRSRMRRDPSGQAQPDPMPACAGTPDPVGDALRDERRRDRGGRRAAGLVAARELRRAGRRVRLLEARQRFGGRAWSAPFARAGRLVELGGGWFDSRLQRPLREEVARYGVRVVPAPSFESARWYTGGALRSGFPVPPELGGDLERVIVAINAAGRAWTRANSEDVSISEWLARLEPEPATRDFVYGWCGLMAGAGMDVTPVSALLGLVAETGTAYALYSDLAEVFADGANALTDAIAADLGCPAELDRAVVAVSQDAGAVTVGDRRRGVAARGAVRAGRADQRPTADRARSAARQRRPSRPRTRPRLPDEQDLDARIRRAGRAARRRLGHAPALARRTEAGGADRARRGTAGGRVRRRRRAGRRRRSRRRGGAARIRAAGARARDAIPRLERRSVGARRVGQRAGGLGEARHPRAAGHTARPRDLRRLGTSPSSIRAGSQARSRRATHRRAPRSHCSARAPPQPVSGLHMPHDRPVPGTGAGRIMWHVQT